MIPIDDQEEPCAYEALPLIQERLQMLTPNTLLQNRYLVLRPIGHGGMGTVYQATDTRLHCTVALKQTLLTDEVMRRAFEREARLLARLRHPTLPRVSDHFTEAAGQFLVMEYIQGDDLATLMLRNGGQFPPDRVLGWVLRWGDQLLDALDYLHTQSPPIIHRDIKPQNLKLTPRGDIVLLDFGLARGGAAPTISTASSLAGTIEGYTPSYAPLEQIRGTEPDPRSDLYSLAATLYHFLTGLRPSDALSRAAALLNDKPDLLKLAYEINPQTPLALATLLHNAMALNPDVRPASARAMRQALREAGRTAPGADGDDPARPNGELAIEPTILAARGIDPLTLRFDEPPEVHTGPPSSQMDTVPGCALRQTILTGSPILGLTCAPDSRSVATSGEEGTISLWSVATGELLQRFRGCRYNVQSVAFSFDGRLLAAGGEDKVARVWSTHDGRLLYTLTSAAYPSELVTFSPDNRYLAVSGWGSSVCLWDMQVDPPQLVRTMRTSFVHSLAFSPDSKQLAAGCYDSMVRIWRVADGSLLHVLDRQQNFVLSVAFSAESRLLAAGGGATSIWIWNLDHIRLLDQFEGHTNFVRSLAFSPDGRLLASGSEDRTLRLWRSSDGRQLQILHDHAEGVTSVAFSPDGRLLVSGCRDRRLRLWHVGH